MSDECLQHVDAVVIGEAEYTWPQVLRDAEHGNLKTVYRAPHPTDMKHVPMARRDVLRESSWFTAVEATRGCPNRCSYCYLPSVPWHIHRKRPVELVLEEIRGLPQKSFIFVDENLFADRVYARQLFRAIKPFNKFWLVQAPTNLVDDDETLDAMAEGGCFNVQVGFQSFNRKSLQEGQVNHHRLDRYRDLVQALHQRRIVVSGFFVFGFDSDGLDVFPDTVEAIREIGVDDANMFVLTPFPGTALYVQLAQEGRLLPSAMDREQFVWSKAVYQPRKMTAEELEKGVQWAYDSLHSHFRKKLFKVLMNQFDRLLVNPRFALGIVRGNLRHNKIG
jgi:radical SAM superfamily enzyme YgiQ (UPF0313 family)